MHLVCELPDLEELWCIASFGSLPTELPRQRPRTNRNRLRECHLQLAYALVEHDAVQDICVLQWTHHASWLLEMTLYMNVYDVTSFFSEAEILSILTLAQEYASTPRIAADHTLQL